MEVSKTPRNPGGTEHVQTVCIHAQELGNKAKLSHACTFLTLCYHKNWVCYNRRNLCYVHERSSLSFVHSAYLKQTSPPHIHWISSVKCKSVHIDPKTVVSKE